MVDKSDLPSLEIAAPLGLDPYLNYVEPVPEWLAMAHELFGETLKYRAGGEFLQAMPRLDSMIVVAIENQYRAPSGLSPRIEYFHMFWGGYEIVTPPKR